MIYNEIIINPYTTEPLNPISTLQLHPSHVQQFRQQNISPFLHVTSIISCSSIFSDSLSSLARFSHDSIDSPVSSSDSPFDIVTICSGSSSIWGRLNNIRTLFLQRAINLFFALYFLGLYLSEAHLQQHS